MMMRHRVGDFAVLMQCLGRETVLLLVLLYQVLPKKAADLELAVVWLSCSSLLSKNVAGNPDIPPSNQDGPGFAPRMTSRLVEFVYRDCC